MNKPSKKLPYHPIVGPILEPGYHLRKAQLHADADRACKRKWSCMCGYCRRARAEGWNPIKSEESYAEYVAMKMAGELD